MSHDKKVVEAAERTVADIIHSTLALEVPGVVVGEAPAGAGKSHAVTSAVLAARAKKLRVAVATPTNEQAFSLLDGMAKRCAKEPVCFVPASSVSMPDELLSRHRNLREIDAKDADGVDLLVGTLSKLGDAHARGSVGVVDLLIIDEAFQANSVHYYAVGDLSERHLLLGDRGQLAPFSSAPEGTRWRGLDEDPLLTAVDVVQRNHPDRTRTFKLPITRRLDSRGVGLARAFYPGHAFAAAVLDGVRRLEFDKPSRSSFIDKVIDHAAVHGLAHVELSGAAVTLADAKTIDLIVDTVKRVLARSPTHVCENVKKPTPLERRRPLGVHRDPVAVHASLRRAVIALDQRDSDSAQSDLRLAGVVLLHLDVKPRGPEEQRAPARGRRRREAQVEQLALLDGLAGQAPDRHPVSGAQPGAAQLGRGLL